MEYESFEPLRRVMEQTLKKWHSSYSESAGQLLPYRLIRQQLTHFPPVPNDLQGACKTILQETLKDYAAQDREGAEVLERRFITNQTLKEVSNHLNLSDSQVSRKQRAALNSLLDLIVKKELGQREELIERQKLALPPKSYRALYGINQPLRELDTVLQNQRNFWVVAISGMGGIGKTSLANEYARQIIDRMAFDQVVWVGVNSPRLDSQPTAPDRVFDQILRDLASQLLPNSAADHPQELLFALQKLFSTRPYLVVIDNLEVDAEVAYLTNQLTNLCDPTKFLLTTRTQVESSVPVHNLTISEMSLTDAEAFLQDEAHQRNLQVFDHVTPTQIEEIYYTIGGNPLALKLFISLLDVMELRALLDSLQKKPQGKVYELYRHIFAYSWQLLSEPAKILLLVMPLIADKGGSVDYLKRISRLDDGAFWPALQELRRRSLLEVRGTINERKYGVHRLTATFLKLDILKWEQQPGD